MSDLLDVVRGAGRDPVEKDLFGDSPAEGHYHHIFQLLLGVEVELFWEVLGETESALGSRDDCHL